MRTSTLGLALTFVLLGAAACGGGGGGDGSTPAGTTVIGTVLDRSGQPVPVVPVVVEGHPPMLTDAAGQFRVEGASVPYTVILIKELGQRAQVFDGLTRLDPTFRFGAGLGSRTAALSGTTSGGVGFPLPPDHGTVATFSTTQSDNPGQAGVNPANGDWSIPLLRWSGPLSTTVYFLAVQVHTTPAGLVDDFTGMVSLEVPVGHGDTLSGLNFALAPVDTALCSGTFDAPPGYTFLGKGLYLTHTSGNLLPLPSDSGPLNTFSLATVDSPDVSTSILASLLGPGGGNVIVVRRDIPVPVSGLSLDVPSETVLVSPSNGSAGVGYETPFTVSPDGNRLYTFVWEPQGAGPEIELITNDPVATIPDLASYGLAVPAGELYDWACEVQGPGITVDDFTSGEEAGPFGLSDGFIQYAGSWTFTTGP